MTPLQEAANALSMLCPSIALAFLLPGKNAGTQFLLNTTLMHLPFSFFYHMGCCLSMIKDRQDCHLRRMDQVMQCIISNLIMFALLPATNKPHAKLEVLKMILASMSFACSSFSIQKIYKSKQESCWVPIAIGVFIYTLPILIIHNSLNNFVLALASAFAGGLCFLYSGWGHCLFHVFMGVFAYAIGSTLLLQPSTS